MDDLKVKKFLKTCYSLKPNSLIMRELEWKMLIRSILKAKNIVLTGPTGSGKTMAVYCAVEALNRHDDFHEFNLGASQDPRGFLIGSTHFDKKTGTFFSKSPFVTSITKPNAIIFLDELTRAHPEAHNILMTVLDDQKYLRLDESEDKEKVKVADGVCFVATANIGAEYTATRLIDRAILDRFQKIEIPSLNVQQEYELMSMRFPQADQSNLKIVAKISAGIRKESFSDESTIQNFISTRHALEMAEMVDDGFSLVEICEALVYPMFDPSGGVDSERTYVKQFIQQFIVADTKDPVDQSSQTLRYFNRGYGSPFIVPSSGSGLISQWNSNGP